MRRSKLRNYSVLTAVLAGTAGVTALAPVAAGAATGGVLKLAAGDDAYVSSVRTTAVFGAEEKLAAGVFGNDVKTSFLKFAVPAGTRVAGARLVLTAIGPTTGRVTVSRVPGTGWTEGRLTRANAPATGTVLASAVPNGTLSIDLGRTVTGPGTYAFALSSNAAVVRFHSAEAKTGAPVLEVTTEGDVSPPAPSAPRPTTPAPATPAPKPTTSAPTTPAPKPTTSAPTTPAPTTPAPTTPAPKPTTPADFTTDAKLVPSCGVLLVSAAGCFTYAPRYQALRYVEKISSGYA